MLLNIDKTTSKNGLGDGTVGRTDGDGDSYAALYDVKPPSDSGCGVAVFNAYFGNGRGASSVHFKFAVVNASGEGPLIWSLIRCY